MLAKIYGTIRHRGPILAADQRLKDPRWKIITDWVFCFIGIRQTRREKRAQWRRSSSQKGIVVAAED